MAHALSIPLIVVVAGTAIAVSTDVRGYKVYNILTVPMLIAGLVFHGISGGWAGLGVSTAGMLLGFGVLIVPYLLGAMGAGDVKLVAAIGAWLGFYPTMCILVISLIATAFYSVILLAWNGRFREAWAHLQIAFFRLRTIGRYIVAAEEQESVESMDTENVPRYRLIPFSVMVAVGVALTLGLVCLLGPGGPAD
jgi:prepilin peptidase CpaA